MIAKIGLAAILAMSFCSAALAGSGLHLYGGVPIDADPAWLPAYARTVAHCEREAGMPPRGSLDADDLLFDTAVRACLYRRGFFEGRDAYPVRIDVAR